MNSSLWTANGLNVQIKSNLGRQFYASVSSRVTSPCRISPRMFKQSKKKKKKKKTWKHMRICAVFLDTPDPCHDLKYQIQSWEKPSSSFVMNSKSFLGQRNFKFQYGLRSLFAWNSRALSSSILIWQDLKWVSCVKCSQVLIMLISFPICCDADGRRKKPWRLFYFSSYF